MQTDYLIVGAGIIGSAVAYELTRRGKTSVHVVDPDLGGELSSTERNAGGVRHLWQQRVNVDLSRTSIRFFESIKDEIGFQQTGYLWLYSKAEREAGLDLLKRTSELNVPYEKIDLPDLKDRYPFIDKTDDLAFAIFGPKDGLLNSNALKTYFRERAKNKGATFIDKARVESIETVSDGSTVSLSRFDSQENALEALKKPNSATSTEKETWKAGTVIFCMGAWTRTLSLFNEIPFKLSPIRRQISVFKAEGFDMTPYGMVVDTSRVYFHPEGGNILAGFVVKEEQEGFNFSYDKHFFESHIWPPLYERSTRLEKLKEISGWGGLYHYTPDTSGILGKVPGFENVFEAHSFTGRGLMQSYGAAVALCELILDGTFSTFDANSLSRDRFQGGAALLSERLHI